MAKQSVVGYVKRTILCDCSGGYPSTTTPDAGFVTTEVGVSNKVDVKGVNFAHTAGHQYHLWKGRLPKNYNGLGVTAIVSGMCIAAAPSGVAAFKVSAVAHASGETWDAAFGTAVETYITVVTQYDEVISSESGAMTIGGTPAAGNEVIFRLDRDGTDGDNTSTYAIIGLSVMILYGTNNISDA